MKFSMIELITSLTPRVTLRTATIPAQMAPTAIATTMISRTCSGPGSATAAPTAAAMIVAIRYWPSTPMLNRLIRKPMATARPERNSGSDRLRIATSAVTCWLGVSPRSTITDSTCRDRKSTRLNSSHANISYAVFCLKKKNELLHVGVSVVKLGTGFYLRSSHCSVSHEAPVLSVLPHRCRHRTQYAAALPGEHLPPLQ